MQVLSDSRSRQFFHPRKSWRLDGPQSRSGRFGEDKYFVPLLGDTVIAMTKCLPTKHWERRHRTVTSGELLSARWQQTRFISCGGNATPNVLVRLNNCYLFGFGCLLPWIGSSREAIINTVMARPWTIHEPDQLCLFYSVAIIYLKIAG
jgi:hypothetical protein